MEKTTIAIAGANGFIGRHLQNEFEGIIILDRDDSENDILEKLQNVDIVINLSGAPIVKKWNSEYKKTLYSSRIETTNKLVNAINNSDVSYFISTSAIGIYPNDTRCDEGCQNYSDDFLGRLCQDWEAQAMKCNKPTSILRFGVVLGEDGGALQKMLTPFKMGMGGKIGDGKMITSWVDIDDLMRIYRFLIEHRIEGVFNAVSPSPITNEVFTKAIGEILRRPTFLPLPELALKVIYGEASSVLLDSKEIYPEKLLSKGFVFKYQSIEDSMNHLLGQEEN